MVGEDDQIFAEVERCAAVYGALIGMAALTAGVVLSYLLGGIWIEDSESPTNYNGVNIHSND